MNISCRTQDLSEAVSLAIRAVSGRPIHPILSSLKIVAKQDRIHITGFDLKTAISISVPGTIKAEGSVAVPARLLKDLIDKISSDEVRVSKQDPKSVKMYTDKGKYEISCMDTEEYPDFIKAESEPYSIPFSQFISSIKFVIDSCSDDETKTILTGVFIRSDGEKVTFASTDGHRLAIANLLCECPVFSTVIHKDALKDILKVMGKETSVMLSQNEESLTIVSDDRIVSTRALEGVYPAVEMLVPKEFAQRTIINRQELINSVERAMLCSDKTKTIKCCINNDLVKLSADTSESSAIESISCQHTGDNLEMNFNAVYLSSGLKTLQSDEIEICSNKQNSPVVLSETDDRSRLYLLMPVLRRG